MKRVGLIATIVIATMLIAGYGNINNVDNKTTVNESLAVSSSVGNTENNNSEIVKENQSSTEVTTTEPTTAETSSRKETTAIQKVIQNTTKPTTTSKQPTTKKASQCSNNNNHSMKCGNMGRWFDSKSDVKAYVDSVMKSWADKWESGELSDDEYFANCPQGYECWSCGYCGKWTGNFK